MKELDAHFDCVHKVVAAELGNSNGSQVLSDHLQSPFDTVDSMQIDHWVGNLSRLLSKRCWGTRDFKSSFKTHGEFLFYIAETGDVPQIVNVGYPWMETSHNFQNIADLTQHSTILLPQLIENISPASVDEEPYFECSDLFNCYLDDFGLGMPEIDDLDNMDASRLLVDAVAIVAMVKSWRELDPAPDANVYFCTSSGGYAFGRPACIQSNAR